MRLAKQHRSAKDQITRAVFPMIVGV